MAVLRMNATDTWNLFACDKSNELSECKVCLHGVELTKFNEPARGEVVIEKVPRGGLC